MNNKVAIITGAASGIGKSIARMLVQNNVEVFAIDKNSIDCIGAQCLKADVSVLNDVELLYKEISDRVSCVDYLLLPAGVLCKGKRSLVENLDIEEWYYVMNNNLNGVLFMIRQFVPLLKLSDNACIITYSSDQVQKPIKKSAPYLVSKAGIEALTKLLALELLDYKIRVNCIRSATVDTDFLSPLVKEKDIQKKMRDDMDKKMPYGIISPSDITELSLFLLTEKAKKITGQIISIDSGYLLL